MGNADWTMIARVYGKWMPDAQPDAGKKAVAVYAPLQVVEKGDIKIYKTTQTK